MFKVLANRLKIVLCKCISLEQLVFITGRNILDNAMITFGIIHYLKNKKEGKSYDRVGLLSLLMCFDAKWVRWIQMCISQYLFSFLLTMK